MLFCTFYINDKILQINVMFAKITKSIIEGKTIIAIFYDSEKRLVKTVHFGAAGCPDYTKSRTMKSERKEISSDI